MRPLQSLKTIRNERLEARIRLVETARNVAALDHFLLRLLDRRRADAPQKHFQLLPVGGKIGLVLRRAFGAARCHRHDTDTLDLDRHWLRGIERLTVVKRTAGDLDLALSATRQRN